MCARGSNRALMCGPSTSTLGAKDADRFAARASRGFEVVLGVVATLLGATLLLATTFFAYSTSMCCLPTQGVVLVFLAALALGLLLFFAGLRLVTGKHRSDGGLFSPWILRMGGVIFLFGPVAAVLNRSWFGLVEACISLSAAVACFALANRRKESAANEVAPNNRWRVP